MTLEDELKKLLIEKMGVKKDVQIQNNTSLFQGGLEFDSLDGAELTMEIEDQYEISIPNEKAQSFKTFGDIVNYMKEKLPPDYSV